MQSPRKVAPVVGVDGLSGSRGSAAGREQEVHVLEIDAAFARVAGLSNGSKVSCKEIMDN